MFLRRDHSLTGTSRSADLAECTTIWRDSRHQTIRTHSAMVTSLTKPLGSPASSTGRMHFESAHNDSLELRISRVRVRGKVAERKQRTASFSSANVKVDSDLTAQSRLWWNSRIYTLARNPTLSDLQEDHNKGRKVRKLLNPRNSETFSSTGGSARSRDSMSFPFGST